MHGVIVVTKKQENLDSYTSAISHSGLRLTKQRRGVFDALMDNPDHPTATEVFLRAKRRMPSISLATVYNCLETLVGCGLVRQVNFDRSPTRYCPNLREHGHFICEECGVVFDVPLKTGMSLKQFLQLPSGSSVSAVEFTIRGVCGRCRSKKN